MISHHRTGPGPDVGPLFAQRDLLQPVARDRLPVDGMPPAAADQIVRQLLSLDGSPALNLASFVTTWMDPEADQLMVEAMRKNFIDQEEYPQTTEVEQRCVSMLATLFRAGTGVSGEQAVGASTIGSSEAIHLAGLAALWLWRARRRAARQPTDRPNLVLGSHTHVVWQKFARYFDVELRWVPVAADAYGLDVARAVDLVDEGTIAVVAVLGSTYTGGFDDVAGLAAALDDLAARSDLDVPIHVDAASGGFVAPFAYPDLAWDFRVPRVRSINTSGHKYGLVYAGVGWILWRDAAFLPGDLVFRDDYLGAQQLTFDLNFSKSASQVVGQYYNLLRLGFSGYQRVMQGLLDIADRISRHLADHDRFELLSGPGALPVVTVRLVDGVPFTVHDVSRHLRERGWIVPAYTMPAALEEWSVLRIVVREGFAAELADQLLLDVDAAIEALTADPPARPAPRAGEQHRVC